MSLKSVGLKIKCPGDCFSPTSLFVCPLASFCVFLQTDFKETWQVDGSLIGFWNRSGSLSDEVSLIPVNLVNEVKEVKTVNC